MSTAIKPGDLVMVVLPNVCCGATDSVGKVGTVGPNPSWATYVECDFCGATSRDVGKFRTIDGGGFHVETLRKIDPPAEGDSVPTRREIEVAA